MGCESRIAGEAGASGVIAGRALWHDAVTPDATARRRFLGTVALDRMQRVLEELPDQEEAFITQMMGEVDTTRFVAADYEVG